MQVRVGESQAHFTKFNFLCKQQLRAFEVAVQKYVQAHAQVGDQSRMHFAQFGHASLGKCATGCNHFAGDILHNVFNDVANLLEIDGE